MSLRNALSQARWLTATLLLLLGWVVWVAVDVIELMQPFWGPADPGRTAAAGVVGLLVLLGVIGLLVTLLGEAGRPTPEPDPWPPEQ